MSHPLDAFREELGFIPHLPGAPEAINADSFDEDVLACPVPALVEFWAARCGPCRRLAPEIAAVAAEFRREARVFTLNVDEEVEAAERYGVRSIPAVLLFVGGEEKGRLVGVITRAALVHLIQPYLEIPTEEAADDHA